METNGHTDQMHYKLKVASSVGAVIYSAFYVKHLQLLINKTYK
jgi:hypothetical protein